MKKILIADDDSDLVKLLRFRLEERGYDIEVAHDGQEAIDKIYQLAIDLIILDIDMPKVDGFEICKRMQSDEIYKNIPIILLTGTSKEAADIVRGMRSGAVSYVQKPYTSEVLLGIIEGFTKDNI